MAFLRDSEKRLNAMLAAEAGQHGATYVDTYGPSIGHDICQSAGTRWIEGLHPEGSEAALHPNALGMAATARAVLTTLG